MDFCWSWCRILFFGIGFMYQKNGISIGNFRQPGNDTGEYGGDLPRWFTIHQVFFGHEGLLQPGSYFPGNWLGNLLYRRRENRLS